MILTVQYTDDTDKAAKKLENAQLFLKEEQHLLTGNFLIFTDSQPVEDQLKEQADNTLTVMSAIADLYDVIASLTPTQ